MVKKRIACGATIYNPTNEQIDNLRRYSSYFDMIILYDNTEKKGEEIIGDSIHYISESKNNGLSIAYNSMCNYALDKGYDYLLLLDQDSSYTIDEIEKVVSYINGMNEVRVGLLCPFVEYKFRKKKERPHSDVSYVDFAISSGSFINLEIFKETNGFDEKFFIDWIDYDYCMELKRLGYKIIQINSSTLEQELGQPAKSRFITKEHSALRFYYICRNQLYFYRIKWKKSIKYSFLKCNALLGYRFIRIVLFESQKIRKIKYFFRAYFDYFKRKFGKIG